MMQGMMRRVDAVFKTAAFFMGFCDGSLLNKVNQMDREIFELELEQKRLSLRPRECLFILFKFINKLSCRLSSSLVFHLAFWFFFLCLRGFCILCN